MLKKFLIISVASLALVACGKVPAGNVGVKVYLLGSSKGVDKEVLGPGRYWIGWNQELYLFPTFTQNYVWTAEDSRESPGDQAITFQTREGLTVSADVGISYNIRPDSVPIIFEKYRRGIDEITHLYLRNMVRDSLVTLSSNLPIETVYGEGKADLMAAVEEQVRQQVDPIGINIERIYWIGNVTIPEVVRNAVDAKIEATQRAQQRQNEVAEARAEADKKIETARGTAQSILLEAKAQAEANEILARSLTDPLVRYKAIEQWDGILPKYTGSAAIPFVDVTEK